MSNGNSSGGWAKLRKYIKKSYVISAIILVVVVGGYYYYKNSQANKNQVQYVTALAEKGTLATSVSASGNVIVDQSSNIDPTITGTVSNVSVQVGDQVKKGQLLFTIVNDQLGVSVAQANSSLTSAQGQLKSAKAQKESAEGSLKSDQAKNKTTAGSVNHEQIQADKKQITAAQASIDSAQASIDSQSVNLGYQNEQAGKRNVMSTINGTVNAVNIKNGDDLSKLSSGSSRLVPIIIGDLGTMKAQVQVNEVDVANISVGQKATMKIDALGSDFQTTGKVEKMDSLGTLSSGVVTYNVTIDFDSLDPRLKPEMSVGSSIITDVKQDVLTVPSSAVKTQGGNTYVQVLNGAAPEQKNVTVGASNSTDTEIVSGVSEGDKVVTQTINSSKASSSSSSSTGGGGGAGGLRVPGFGGGGGGRPGGG